MKFNSQICTTREQSERLLSLGLKKETADMVYRSYGYIIDEFGDKERRFKQPTMVVEGWGSKYDIPAWSLHRLIEMMPSKVEFPLSGMPKNFYFEMRRGLVRYYNGYVCCVMEGGGYYEGIIDSIEWLIKKGYFNKEYLV